MEDSEWRFNYGPLVERETASSVAGMDATPAKVSGGDSGASSCGSRLLHTDSSDDFWD